MGAAPIYYVLLAGMGMVAMSASIWHLPAAAALSHHFSHRRGMSFSFHGVGGNIGDVVAPVVTGALLGVLSWQGILNVYAAIPLSWPSWCCGPSGTLAETGMVPSVPAPASSPRWARPGSCSAIPGCGGLPW